MLVGLGPTTLWVITLRFAGENYLKRHTVLKITSIVKRWRGYISSQGATQRIFVRRTADLQQGKRCAPQLCPPRRNNWDDNTEGEREVTLAPLKLLEQLHFSFVHFNERQTGPGNDTNLFCSEWCHNLHQPRGRDATLQPSSRLPASTSAGGAACEPRSCLRQPRRETSAHVSLGA